MALWDKESACNAGDTGNVALIPGLDRSLGGREWQPTPVFLPKKKSHGQRSLAGYSPKCLKESHVTEQLNRQAKKWGGLFLETGG